MKAIILYPRCTYSTPALSVKVQVIHSARDRSQLMEMGVRKELVYELSGREAHDLLKALLVIREACLEDTPKRALLEVA